MISIYPMKKTLKLTFIFLISTLTILFCTQPLNADFTTTGNTVSTRVGNPPTSSHPTPPNYPPDLIAAIKQQFGIVIEPNNGGAQFTDAELKQMWEKFWDISGTNFFNLNIKGVTIRPQAVVSCPNSDPSFLGCATGSSAGPDCPKRSIIDEKVGVDTDTFSLDLMHELGHIIDWCNTRSVNHEVDVANAYSSEGGVSAYARSTNYYEDYAEMTAFYFNPDIPAAGTSKNPFAGGGYPTTYNIAKTVYGDY